MKFRVDYLKLEMTYQGKLCRDMVCSRHLDTFADAQDFARDINRDYRVVGLRTTGDNPIGFVMPYQEYVEKIKSNIL